MYSTTEIIKEPLVASNGELSGIIVMAQEVTEEVLEQLKINKSQQDLLASFNDSPVGLSILVGEELRVKMVNPFAAMLAGRPAGAMIDKPLFDAMPELIGQGFDKSIRDVLKSEKPFTGREVPVEVKRGDHLEIIYIDHTFQPLRNNEGVITGVLVVVMEVTKQVHTRIQIEEKEAALRNAIELAELGTWTYDVATGLSILSAQHATMLGLESGRTSFNEGLQLVIEEDREIVKKAFQDALHPGSIGRFESEFKAKNARTGNEIIIRALGLVSDLLYFSALLIMFWNICCTCRRYPQITGSWSTCIMADFC